jgi:hypothetical protein
LSLLASHQFALLQLAAVVLLLPEILEMAVVAVVLAELLVM